MKIIIFMLYPNEDHCLLCFFSLSSSIASLPRLPISSPPPPPPPPLIHKHTHPVVQFFSGGGTRRERQR
ncbi:hypothetical protein Hanom_Chr07g00589741 [Helianthus anomalus]